eukprot:gnl/TRDRNA2_/TRDRNA2_177460_c0_seq1.p1 gnl/TRDRNA2_/TRDRNA2_177460_c0~~gnl/TRDRNA2_/TRDRNA2_177460_c0_seq1.p1  ORF type:complete len:804 (-),score=-71.61 gnl/TRDRNA2_/TRDRNA2_177460_c0_seq1:124-2535(-)
MEFSLTKTLNKSYKAGNTLFWNNNLLVSSGRIINLFDLDNGYSRILPLLCTEKIKTMDVDHVQSVLVCVDVKGKLALVDLKTKRPMCKCYFSKEVSQIKFSPNGMYVAVIASRVLQVWNQSISFGTSSPMHIHRVYSHSHGDILCLDWSNDSLWIALGSADTTVRLYSYDNIQGIRVNTLIGHNESLIGVFFIKKLYFECKSIHSFEQIISVSSNGMLLQWYYEEYNTHSPPFFLPTGIWMVRRRHFFEIAASKLSSVGYHKSEELMILGYSTGIVELYRLSNIRKIQSTNLFRQGITSIALDETGEWLALGCASLERLILKKWRSEKSLLKQSEENSGLTSVAYSENSNYIATGSENGKIEIWNANTGLCVICSKAHTSLVSAVAFLPDSRKLLLSSSMDGSVKAFDISKRKHFRTFTSKTFAKLSCLAIDPTWEVLCAGSEDTYQIFCWSMRTGELINELNGHEAPISSLAYTNKRSSNPFMASGSWDCTVRLWHAYGNKKSYATLQHNYDVLALALRPDGRQLSSSTLDGHLYLWNLETGHLDDIVDVRNGLLCEIRGHSVTVNENVAAGKCFLSLAYSPCGGHLLAAGHSKFVYLYDTIRKVVLSRYEIEGFSSITKNPSMICEKSSRFGWIRSIAYSTTGHAWCAATSNEVFIYQKNISDSTFHSDSKNQFLIPKIVSDAKFLLTPSSTPFMSNSSYSIGHTLGRESKLHKTTWHHSSIPTPKLIHYLIEISMTSPHIEYYFGIIQEIQKRNNLSNFLDPSNEGDILYHLEAISKILAVFYTSIYLLSYIESTPIYKK